MRVALHRPVLTALILGSTSLAGAASWTGYVFNGETRTPLAGVLVHAGSGLVATTDAQGKCLIQDQATSVARAASAGNGTDIYGFRALPAGRGGLSGSALQGSAAYWWTSSDNSAADPEYAIGRWIKDGDVPVNSSAILRTLPLSVRCVKN